MFDARDKINNFYEEGFFPYNEKTFKTKEKEQSEEKEELDENKFFKNIEKKSKGIKLSCLKNILIM